MSYARFSEGDIYLYPGGSPPWICCNCKLMPEVEDPDDREYTHINSLQETFQHVIEHRKAGHLVPDRCIKRLKSELGL